jgi:geranylgeranylglycerol-phosphate geranylgeranyltransferase
MGLRDWYDLVRFEHGVMWGLCVLIGEFLAYEGVPSTKPLLLGFFVPILTEMGAFALNDYADYEKDKINKRMDRPLVRGTIRREHALIVAVVTLAAAFLLGLMFVGKAFVILVVFLILGVLYDIKLKQYSALKNLTLALCVAIPFPAGNIIIQDTIVPMVYFITLVAFIVGFGREVMKDLMDIEGDKATGVKTFPMIIGERASAMIVVVLYVSTVLLTLPPFIVRISDIYYHNTVYGTIILATDALLLYTCYLLGFKLSLETVKRCRTYTWAAMIVAVLGFFVPLVIHFWGG